MADDDKTADAPKPVTPPSPKAKAAKPRPARNSSEWTASDGRGPLETAADGEEPAIEPDTSRAETPVREARVEAAPFSQPHAGFGPKPESDASVTPSPSVSTSTADVAVERPTATGASSSRERLFWPLAAAIVLGALSGAGSAYLMHGSASEDQGPAPQVASLAARVDALEKRPDPQAAVTRLEASVAALSSKVASLQGGTGQAQPADNAPAAASAVDSLNRKIAALQADLDNLKAQGADARSIQDKVAALEGTVAGMKTATAAAQSGVTTVEGEEKSLAGRVTMPALAVVADSLVQQIAQGLPYATQVDALVALDADPAKVAVLRQNADKGVPSAKILAAKFAPLAEPIEATAHKPSPNAGFLDRLKSGALSMVSIRRADDTSGDDLPSRVARIEAALAHDDVLGAVAVWDALPPDAQAKGAAWGVLAKTSAEAMSAARALQHDAIAALATKKS